MNAMERFEHLCHRCRDFRDVTRLWNWADHQPDPEEFWQVLADVCGFAFRDVRDANSIIFQY